MRRRRFLVLLGGGTAWPLVGSAQQGNQGRRVGVLMAIRENDLLRPSYVEAFTEGLRAAGWLDGKNIQLDYRWAGPDIDRIKRNRHELPHGSDQRARL